MLEGKYKICSKCNKRKSIKKFYKDKKGKNGLTAWCKVCILKIVTERRIQNPNYRKNRYIKNREHEINYQRIRRKNNPDKIKQSVLNWRINHPEQVRLIKQRSNKKARTTIIGRLNANLSVGISKALKGKKAGRHWETIVCMIPLDKLIPHLETYWTEGMSWDNYGQGKNKWNMEHSICKVFFKYKDTEDVEFQYCWSLDNLRPMWQQDNMLKGNKLPQEWEEFKRKYPERLYKFKLNVTKENNNEKRN